LQTNLYSSVEVAYKEGPVNLNWGMIMKTVNEDPVEFFKNGGWNFLGQDSDVCKYSMKRIMIDVC
jgi:nucleosome binding factor SPN SPT16 subunit